MKKWFYLILYLFVIFILTSCHTGRVLVDDNVQFSDDYETIIHNNVSYKVFNFLDSNLHRTISDDDILIYKGLIVSLTSPTNVVNETLFLT